MFTPKSTKYKDIITLLASKDTESHKNEVLSLYKEELTWRKLLVSAYSPTINYWLKTVKDEHWMPFYEGGVPLYECLESLDKLSNRGITGDAAYDYFCNLLISCDEPEVLLLALKRDLKIGAQAKTINKVMGSNYIPETPYARCGLLSEKTSKNIRYPSYAQLKVDGQYVAMSSTEDTTFSVSRQGKDYDFLGNFDEEIEALRNAFGYDITITGEMLTEKDGKIQSREYSNGITQKFGKGTGSIEEANELIYIIWDCIPYTSYINGVDKTEYKQRFETLEDAINKLGLTKIKLIKTKIVNSYDEAVEFYLEQLNLGEEGAIVKDFSAEWKNGTATKMLKVKIKFDVDLRIKGFNKGSDDAWNKDILGSVYCESECGQLGVSIGQWSDEMRYHIWENKELYMDKIMEVTAHRITKDKKSNKPSLYLGRFKAWRDGDKDSADTFERIKEIEESVMLAKLMSK